MNKIIRTIIPQQVRVRKYEVDIAELQQTLREHRVKEKLTNKEIAEKLNQPLTLVEHWFRTDSSFSIPTEDVWFKLKELLNINIDKFDVPVTTFEVRDGVYDKSNRVYDTEGIAPTLTATNAETEKYIVDKIEPKTNKLLKLGNIYPKKGQAGEVYDSNGVCSTLVTFTGGGGKQPIVAQYPKKEDSNKTKFNNFLKKYNFEMESVKLFDSFAGIGALHQSLKELGVPVEVIGISEIDIDAIISYAGVHIDNFINLDFTYPSEIEMKDYLITRNIGWDFIKKKSSIPRLKKNKLYQVYKASVLLNNLGDISLINYKNIPNFDLFNFSFSCTDISNAGQRKGFKNEDGTLTRSGLYIYGLELIKSKKPKYIMIENVKGLIQKTFIDNFYEIIHEIEFYGYKCYYPTKSNNKPTCLNAKDYGVPQNRERIFVICIRNDVNDGLFEFPIGFDNGIRLKDLLEDNVDEKYYVSQEKCEKLIKNLDNNKIMKKLPKGQSIKIIGTTQNEGAPGTNSRRWVHNPEGIIGAIDATTYKEPKQICIPCITPDRLEKRQNERRFKEDGDPSFTLTAQDRHGVLLNENNNPQVLRPVRTEYGKKIRKQYEAKEIEESRHNMTKLEPRTDGISNTLSTVQKDNLVIEPQENKIQEPTNKPIEAGYYPYPNSDKKHQSNTVYNSEGISPTLDTMQGGNRQPKVIEGTNTELKPELVGGIGEINYGKQYRQGNRVYSTETIAMSLMSQPVGNTGGYSYLYAGASFRIRKLTPLECWLLMGFRKECFLKAQELGVADSSLYKQAGNSIVVNVLYYIFKNLFKKYIV